MKPKVLDVQPYKGPDDLAERAAQTAGQVSAAAQGTLEEQFIAALAPLCRKYAGDKAALRKIIQLVLSFGVSAARDSGMRPEQLSSLVRDFWEGGPRSVLLQ